MPTVPFLVKFGRVPNHQETPRDKSTTKYSATDQEIVTPQPPSTTMTRVQNETTDDT